MAELTLEHALSLARNRVARGEISEAQKLYGLILQTFPNNKEAQQSFADLTNKERQANIQALTRDIIDELEGLYNQKRYAAVIERAQSLTALYPQAFIVENLLGAALYEVGKSENALKAFERVIELNPEFAEAFNNIGIIQNDNGDLDAAVQSYKHAILLKPDYAVAYNNLGNSLKSQGNLSAAIQAYKAAVQLEPNYSVAISNMAVAFKDQGNLVAAVDSLMKALSIAPNSPSIYGNLGNALRSKGELGLAVDAYTSALALRPDFATVEAQLLHVKTHICDFSIFPHLSEASARLGIKTEAVPTFSALSWVDDPREQYLRSKKWALEKFKQKPLLLAPKPLIRPDRIKVGYFGADFHDHATMYLIAGLLRQHNKEVFEIFAFSYGRSKEGSWRRRVEGCVDHFFDVSDQNENYIVDLAHSHCLDIAIDLKGYTTHSRSGIFQYRLAPIQVNYLGYPGTMGADFIDYIIADHTVIPDEQREYYSEKVIYLPHSYQPNDDARELASVYTSRADFGLPEDCFVFCCFNNSYKISPCEFNTWMRLLNQVDNSVLWLLKSNDYAGHNLRKEASVRGVNPERLVFAEKVSHARHLARHRHADVFIDTFNVNAHTTASDALWSGLPIVTKQGKQFAARVSASLLRAVGLPELIAETNEQYEHLILELASQPEKLKAIKTKLAQKRLREPLFDTKRYTRNFERGLKAAYNVYFERKKMEDIWVTEDEV